MILVLAAFLSAAQPAAAAPPQVEPLDPPGCFGFFGMVLFDSGSTRLSPATRAMLDNFIAGQRTRPIRSGALITGYADRMGSRRANLALARRRALAVRAYLVAGGVPAQLIEIVARPEDQGLVDTADGVAEQQNRNVQILEQVPQEVSARWDAWVRIHGYSGPVC
jgi:outer membrane protein OmpA-like peptidoglycan-associated protein